VARILTSRDNLEVFTVYCFKHDTLGARHRPLHMDKLEDPRPYLRRMVPTR